MQEEVFDRMNSFDISTVKFIGQGWYSNVYEYPKNKRLRRRGKPERVVKLYMEMEDHESGSNVWELFQREERSLEDLREF